MKNVIIVGCGSYMDSTYGCPGEWRCLKASAFGEGEFKEPARVVAFVRCECPGRATLATIKMAIKLSNLKPDEIYLSNCFFKPRPECPYLKADEFAKAIEETLGLKVHFGTHSYG